MTSLWDSPTICCDCTFAKCWSQWTLSSGDEHTLDEDNLHFFRLRFPNGVLYVTRMELIEHWIFFFFSFNEAEISRIIDKRFSFSHSVLSNILHFWSLHCTTLTTDKICEDWQKRYWFRDVLLFNARCVCFISMEKKKLTIFFNQIIIIVIICVQQKF